MMWTVTVMPTAEKQLARIPNPDKGRILAAIVALEDGIEGRDVRPLEGGRAGPLRCPPPPAWGEPAGVVRINFIGNGVLN